MKWFQEPQMLQLTELLLATTVVMLFHPRSHYLKATDCRHSCLHCSFISSNFGKKGSRMNTTGVEKMLTTQCTPLLEVKLVLYLYMKHVYNT